MMDLVIADVDQLRTTLPDRIEPDHYEDLAGRLMGSRRLREQPVVAAFIDDIRTFREGSRLTATKAHINSRRDNHIFSLFRASYFPTLSLDYLTYEPIAAARDLAGRYPSNTMAVNVAARSAGFADRAVVALFPENHVDGRQDPGDLIFYFIDRFVERHNRITRKMIDTVMTPASFPHIRDAPDSLIEQASSWWVHLHEYHHQHGDMPIPAFLGAKSAKSRAGLEELRVDTASMLACLNDGDLPGGQARAAFEYILAERLLRYAVEGIPRPTYDAVGSQVLFTYLLRHDGIALVDGLIHLRPQLPAVLAGLLREIEEIELRVHDEPLEKVQDRLTDLVHAYTLYDRATRRFLPSPYFADAGKRLGL
ncbi:DUF6421 family protein [Nonomuraea typhae]|uniref:DUF6421 family protein n=1 Tax=Nonomuraea typhae TaxID=2603600 RepID=A0ABW7ZFS1_9ACTN